MAGNRPQFGPKPVFNSDTGQDMSGDITGLVSIVQDIIKVGYGISWRGTAPVGILNVQVSNDYSVNSQGDVLNAGTWNTMPFDLNGTTVSDLPVSGDNGNGFIEIDVTAAYAMRLIYTATSGVGTINAIATGKGF